MVVWSGVVEKRDWQDAIPLFTPLTVNVIVSFYFSIVSASRPH
jgi:hypothetical protein